MPRKHTLLVVPANDPEAAMIIEIARAMAFDLWVSRQPHGAVLEQEKDLLEAIRDEDYDRVVIVEMPGPKSEAKLEAQGREVVIIDHHEYTGIDRARDKRGKYLPSSLEQFLKTFRITDEKLASLGFDPRLVKGIGIWDRGFYWACEKEGYKKSEIKKLIAYREELMDPYRDRTHEEEKDEVARKAWEKRKMWKDFVVVEDKTDISIRGRLSLIIALEIGTPTPMILVEKGRGFIYVQESDFAEELFEKFGGFTFGSGRNWGHKNRGAKKKVELKEVKAFLSERYA